MNPDIKKLQYLNDLITQTLDVINQRTFYNNIGTYGTYPNYGVYGTGLSHTPYYNDPRWTWNVDYRTPYTIDPRFITNTPHTWNQGLSHTPYTWNQGLSHTPFNTPYFGYGVDVPYGTPVVNHFNTPMNYWTPYYRW